jgi:hypothetical protein
MMADVPASEVAPVTEVAGMSITTALVRVGYLLDRYAGCDSQVLRVMSAVDLEAVKVLANVIRDCDWCPAARSRTEEE